MSRGRLTDPSSPKVLAGLLFVVLAIVVFGRPVLESAILGQDPAEAESATGARERAGAGPRGRELSLNYPRRCLRPAPPPEGLGLVAAAEAGATRVATPGGVTVATLPVGGPIGWSPSGETLATERGELWGRDGASIGQVLDRPTTEWAWSPVSDCIVAVQSGDLVAIVGLSTLELMLSGPVIDFAFSPSGEKLLVAIGGRSNRAGIWLADLDGAVMRQLQDRLEALGPWVLFGWSRAERPLLVQDPSLSRPPSVSPGFVLAPPGTATQCGDEIIVARRGRLATFGVTGTPAFLEADRAFRYQAVACTPDRRSLAVVRARRGAPGAPGELVLLDRSGLFVSDLSTGRYADLQPAWGPPGAGLLFVRRNLDSGRHEVWFLPPRGAAHPTGLTVELSATGEALLDWSADAPIGHPLD
ncbi:MAG: hypothetical protein M3238_07645 [Actinomycetota bacterium]|nr:hypothetical protein [Actinomycetota bacterium]